MSLIFVDVVQECSDLIDPCDDVYVCLKPEWQERTVCGFALAAGRIVAVNEWNDPGTAGDCCTCAELCEGQCIYQVEIDDSQFLINPTTSLPWQPTAADICEIIPYACTVENLISGIKAIPDYGLTCDGLELTADAGLNQNVIEFPIIDYKTGDPFITCDVTIPGGTLVPNNGAATLTYTSSPGQVTVIDVCALTATCPEMNPTFSDPGPAPSGTDRLEYSNGGDIIYQGPENLLSANDCSGGIGNDYMLKEFSIAGTDWTIESGPEHFALAESVRFPQLNYGDPVSLATLVTGSSSTPTAAFVSAEFFNPSQCRPCRCIITLSMSMAAQLVPASGTVVWGHSLWINGAVVADRNGRDNAGFNISWSDSPGFLQDYTQPPIVYAHEIPAGGSVVVGYDFGNNLSFPSFGTTLFVSTESQQIAICGSTI